MSKMASVLQAMRRQIRRKEEIYMQWIPGHSKHLGKRNWPMGWHSWFSKGTNFCPAWMKMAFQEDSEESY